MSTPPKRILMVFPAAPWPPRNNGVSIRYYPIIEHLARKHAVDVYVHGERRSGIPEDPILKVLNCVKIDNAISLPPAPVDRLLTLAENLSPFGQTHNFSKYHTDVVYDRLRQFVAGRKYDTVLWVAYEYRQVLSRLRPYLSGARIVYDSVDSPYLYRERQLKARGAIDALGKFDLWKTRRWEQSLLRDVDATAYISKVDASAGCVGRETHIIPNGIYTANEHAVLEPNDAGAPCIGYLGDMSYRPNVLAAKRLHDQIFRPMKKDVPNLKLLIIGRSPDPTITDLAGPDVTVTGTVDSIWPHIAKVTAFVYPLSTGSGLQNKILEAMHASKPVVTTDICLASIGAKNGSEILAGNTDEEIRAQTLRLLRDRELAHDIAMRGKRYVDSTYEMSSVIDKFERFLFI